MQGKMVVAASVILMLLFWGSQEVPAAEDAGLVIVVSQDANGDLQGTDETPILAAIKKARQRGGGTVRIGPGKYLIRRGFKLTSNITIAGTEQTVLVTVHGFSGLSGASQDELP